MSFSRRTDDSTTIRKGLQYSDDSISPKSPVNHSSKGVFSDTRRETSETRQQRDGRTTKRRGTARGVGDKDACITKHTLSEITRTNDSVGLDDKKDKMSDGIHGVLKVPESIRTVSSPKKGPAIIQGGDFTRNIGNNGTIMHEISTCETNLNNLVSRWSGDTTKFQHIIAMCTSLQQLWKKAIEDGREYDCNRIWQNCHYIVIESTRRRLAGKSCKVGELKEDFLKFLELSIEFYTGLVEQLQLNEADSHSKRKGKMSVLMCHHFNIYTGDLCRYREQLVTKPNWAKPRSYYLKAQQLAPKNGKPYNQLAVIAIHAHRRLDAVYYYIRSLTASNPFLSAKESLSALFDETSRKAEKEEEREKAEEEQKKKRRERRHKKASESVESYSKEVWMLPWQVDKMEDVQSSVSPTSDVYSVSPSTQVFVPEQPNPELIKTMVSSLLVVHGKLFTKIGLERITDAVEKCLSIWRLVLHHQLSVNDTSRFMKMLVLCLFSLHNVAEREQASTPACLYYCGLAGSFLLQFLLEVFLTCNCILLSFIQNPVDEITSPANNDDKELAAGDQDGITSDKVHKLFDHLACYLPLVKIWYDWLSCQWQLWSDCHQEIKDEIMKKFWKTSEEMLNCLIDLGPFLQPYYSKVTLTTGTAVPLWEDKSLAGFMPLKGLMVQPAVATDNASCKDTLTEGLQRIRVILQTSQRLFGEVDHPSSGNDNSRRTAPLLYDGTRFILQQQSVVCPGSNTVSSRAEDSDDTVKKALVKEEMDSDSDSSVIVEDDEEEHIGKPAGVTEQHLLSDIERLRIEKEQLTRRLQDQQQTKQDIEQVLETRAKQEICQQKIIVPKYIVPDTNCFIFDLISIQRLVGSGHFTVVIPLTVVMELEGLMKGSTSRADAPTEGARKAVDYLKQCFEVKERCVKLLTTKGNFLSTMSIRSEMTGIQISNDDYILLSSVNLHCKVDGSHKTSGATGDRYTVALLTDDRNLRVKAYAQEFPVKGLMEFMEWCKL